MPKRPHATGHRFGPDLVCLCGVEWESHQTAQTECPLARTEPDASPDEPGDVESEEETPGSGA